MCSIPNPKNRITPTLTIQQFNQNAHYRGSLRNHGLDLGLPSVPRYIQVAKRFLERCQICFRVGLVGIIALVRAEMLRNPCFLGGPQRQARGSKSEVATSPLPSREAKRGRRCYVTPAFPGGPKEGGNAT